MDFEELQMWFKSRPKWLQDCARRLIKKGHISQEDYMDLLVLCKDEAIGKNVHFSGISEGSFALQESTKNIRLKSIANICGINALCPDTPLKFGKGPICIIYGRNGSGKSGYVRLLKHACGVKNPGNLLSNVFLTANQPHSAEFIFTEGEKEKSSKWTGESIADFRGIEIYDTTCGLEYINQENEIAYEPWILYLFTQLTEACTNLASLIKAEIDGMTSLKPDFPTVYESTTASIWYTNISESTIQSEVEKETAWTSVDKEELNEINKRLIETKPSEKADHLRREAKLIKEFVYDLKNLAKDFEDSKCREYIRTKKDASRKRKVADKDATKVFSKAPLTGIGSETWRLLWEAARKYSNEHAYKTQVFPYVIEDARCVLCQRKLDQESIDRFVSFEKYVKGELQQIALEAEHKFMEFFKLLSDIPSLEIITMRLEAARISDQGTIIMVNKYIKALTARKQTMLNANRITDISLLPKKKVLISLVKIARNLYKKARSCDQDAAGQNRPQLEQRLRELKAREWLNQQHQTVNNEIARLTVIKQLKNALDLTNTTALSRRKSNLTEELITNAYTQRFHDELKGFKAGHISVDLKKTRTEVGKVYHRIFLKNANVDVNTMEILSEGEFRIVSLAAFLADTEGRGSKTTFIFDDPISSLDHTYEEITAQRLVRLSMTRQVIVFTHRLSLVGYLTKYTKKYDIKSEIVCLSQYHIGKVTDLPINLKSTSKAVNFLLNESLAKAKKAFEKSDIDYENVARGICSNIRILIERIVEMDLLNEVVRRFCEEVNTKGKIGALAKITESDCSFIDEYMTKYSKYEHSQSEEAPIPLPFPDEIENDLNEIKRFIVNVNNRNN